MKIFLSLFFLPVLLLACVGCSDTGTTSLPNKFATEYVPIEFSFPSGWQRNTEENPFDLQCFSRFKRINTGVFVFKQTDLDVGTVPGEILEAQIEDLRSKRQNFTLSGEKTIYQAEGKKITTVVYSGDKDRDRNFYKFSLIEFDNEESVFAVVLQIALPEDWKKSRVTFEQIIRSAKYLPIRGEAPHTDDN